MTKRNKQKRPPAVNEAKTQEEIPFASGLRVKPGGETPIPAANAEKAAQAYRQVAAPSSTPNVESTVAPTAAETVPTEQLRAAEAKRDEYLRLAQATQAELENYRKRVERDRENLKRDSLGFFLREFFGAFDDLDRAIAEGDKTRDYASFATGVELVRKNLWSVMEKVGVKRMAALDEKFDPKVHEAMTMIPIPGKEPNTVVEVFQNGYTLDGFVLRPAKVVVSVPAPEAAQ